MNKVETFRSVALNESSRVYVDALNYSTATVQFQARTAVSTVVLTLKGTNSLDATWQGLQTATTLGPSNNWTATVTIGFRYLAAEVTTPEGATDSGDIYFCLKE